MKDYSPLVVPAGIVIGVMLCVATVFIETVAEWSSDLVRAWYSR